MGLALDALVAFSFLPDVLLGNASVQRRDVVYRTIRACVIRHDIVSSGVNCCCQSESSTRNARPSGFKLMRSYTIWFSYGFNRATESIINSWTCETKHNYAPSCVQFALHWRGDVKTPTNVTKRFVVRHQMSYVLNVWWSIKARHLAPLKADNNKHDHDTLEPMQHCRPLSYN